jgi:hypothetical protein
MLENLQQGSKLGQASWTAALGMALQQLRQARLLVQVTAQGSLKPCQLLLKKWALFLMQYVTMLVLLLLLPWPSIPVICKSRATQSQTATHVAHYWESFS